MKIKTVLIAFLFVFLNASNAKPVTWISASYGYWDNPLVWSGGIVPPYTSSDTFLIRHPVAYNYDLFFDTNAYIQIDSTGGLCGHHNITIHSGAILNKYGILEADSLFIPGGHVYCYLPGEVILTVYGMISNGGSFESNCSVIVGEWFECQQPIYAFTLGTAEIAAHTFELFPNPANSFIYITTQQVCTLEVFSMQGLLMMQRQVRESITQFDISRFAKGIYLVRINSIDKTALIKLVKD